MPRFPRKELPAGFALRELPPDALNEQTTYQAYRQTDPSQESPRYTRRLKAVEWCWLKLGEEAAAKDRR